LAIFHIQLPPTPNSRKIGFHSIFWYILQTAVNLLYPFAKSLAFLAIAVKIQADKKNTPLFADMSAIPPAHTPQPSNTSVGQQDGVRSRQNRTATHSSARSRSL